MRLLIQLIFIFICLWVLRRYYIGSTPRGKRNIIIIIFLWLLIAAFAGYRGHQMKKEADNYNEWMRKETERELRKRDRLKDKRDGLKDFK